MNQLISDGNNINNNNNMESELPLHFAYREKLLTVETIKYNKNTFSPIL
jgi:hypothetical protein